jgi:hypothetical protein
MSDWPRASFSNVAAWVMSFCLKNRAGPGGIHPNQQLRVVLGKQGLRPGFRVPEGYLVYSLRIIIHFKVILPVFPGDPIPSKRGYLK